MKVLDTKKCARGGAMLAVVMAALLALPAPRAAASSSDDVGCVSTTFRLASPNDKICVTAYTDPQIPAVSCYLSQARTGGYKGAVGLAEDPARFGLACVATGPVTLPAKLSDDEDVFSERTSLIFKKTTVHRFVDRARGVLIYIGYSTKIVDGSPMNAISVVPYSQP